jgi:hypothetical protein
MSDWTNTQFGIRAPASTPIVDERIQCAASGAGVKARPHQAGEKVRCSCGQAIRVPAPYPEDHNAGAVPETPPSRPSPCWNVISVVAPFLGLLSALVIVALWRGHPLGLIAPCLGLFFGFSAVGLVSAFVAIARWERPW